MIVKLHSVPRGKLFKWDDKICRMVRLDGLYARAVINDKEVLIYANEDVELVHDDGAK